MGTRSLTVVQQRWDTKKKFRPLVTIYRHWDGNPEGHGLDVANFLDGLSIVNGAQPGKCANGPGRLACQLIAYLQSEGHDPDIVPAKSIMGQEYEYHIFCDMSMQPRRRILVHVFDGPTTAFGMGGENCTNLIFKGTVPQYVEWINGLVAKEAKRRAAAQ